MGIYVCFPPIGRWDAHAARRGEWLLAEFIGRTYATPPSRSNCGVSDILSDSDNLRRDAENNRARAVKCLGLLSDQFSTIEGQAVRETSAVSTLYGEGKEKGEEDPVMIMITIMGMK